MLDLITNWWPVIGIVLALVWAMRPPPRVRVLNRHKLVPMPPPRKDRHDPL
jgi:hypothetical protein